MSPAIAPPSRALYYALLSRILLLSLIATWRLLFRPYDTSASLNPPCLSSSSNQSQPSDQILWPRVASAIESSVVWDGVYFVRIAECGYEYEQTYAFLPLLPVAISLLSRSVFAPLVPLIGYRAVLALSGYMLSNTAFVLATLYLYRLSNLILKDSAAALRASVLFCLNPASIFYSSIYSESLYALFSFGGLFHLFSGSSTLAMIMLALSGSARSNGAVNAGYFCFMALMQAISAVIQKKRPFLAVGALLVGFLRSVFIFAPFLVFQVYAYLNICQSGNSEKPRPWCQAKVPLLYGFIQSHYWGVGFLRYFQIKQLPNFLLASPTISLALGSIMYYTRLLHDNLIQSSLLDFKERKRSSHSISTSDGTVSSKGNKMLRQRRSERVLEESEPTMQISNQKKGSRENVILFLPFILHLAFMIFTAFFVMHVQVSTRFLSASPTIYWFGSHVFASQNSSSRKWGYLIMVYFIMYFLLGSLLFSNFYPFT
ncbi:GPI mannosyltransferase 2 [Carex littledalei]|uniref:GPI mannosyltransferase 2 n=1 Tax=Carex littledalei TaxID=544730 RepID=A0A833VFS3_9POAL|nr:GPI mannosyltransferase 2 [Carex littledalei]